VTQDDSIDVLFGGTGDDEGKSDFDDLMESVEHITLA